MTGFLLGLILVMAVFLVAIEYTSSAPTGVATDDELLDDIMQDLDLTPTAERDHRVAAVSKQKPQAEQIVKPVDKEAAAAEEEQQTAEAQIAGEDSHDAAKQQKAEPQPMSTPDAKDGEPAVRIVEQLPEFPGGMSAFVQWLTKNLRYPDEARNRGIVGMVVVNFIVNKDGTVSDIKLQQSVNPILDREALRVLRMMPKWKPGVETGKPCRTMMSVPIVFKL